MNIGIISIGDEILSGFTVNTNASWIGKELTNIGFSINNQITTRDNHNSILNALNNLSKKEINYIIITGGLGSTDDDITREALFEFVSAKEIFDKSYWEFLKKRNNKFDLKTPKIIQKQALIPDKGKIIENPYGSARGFQFNIKYSTIFSLPGVPYEMKKMMENSIIPYLKNKLKKPKITKIIKTYGISESRVSEKIKLIISNFLSCSIGYYPSPYGVDIRVSGYNLKDIDKLIIILKNNLKKYIFSLKNESLEKTVLKLAIKKNRTISIAESCTGGLISNRITNVSGSSKILRGAIVCYSNESKIKLLGINESILHKYGAVSNKIAFLMASNALKIFSSDYALSVTGISGPTGGSKSKPVGLVYIALSNFKETKVEKFHFHSNREINKIKTSQAALNLLRMALLNE